MILLDTDHLTILAFAESARYESLSAKIRHSSEQFGTTIVCIEEQLRGWLAAIRRRHEVHQQITFYDRLRRLWDAYKDWTIFPFDERAADQFTALRKQKIRIGSQDLKIASIALVHDALLLSANLRDFRQVSGLSVENWLLP